MSKIKCLITIFLILPIVLVYGSNREIQPIPASNGLLVEKTVSHKPSWKEKIIKKVLERRIKRELRKGYRSNEKDAGKTAYILGIIGLSLVLIPYGAIASIPLAIIAIVMGKQELKRNPENKKAKTAIKLGWITLGVTAVLIILGLIFLLAFAAAWG